MKYVRGTTASIEIEIEEHTPNTDEDEDSLADPGAGAKITIRRKTNNEAVVDNASMTNSSTGKYYYKWQTDSDTALGEYVAEVLADGGTNDSKRTKDFSIVRWE